VHARFDTLVGLDTTNAPALATVIVSGGHAKGLGGVNKGTLSIGSSAIIDRQLEVLRALATGVFMVGRAHPRWNARGLRVVPDRIHARLTRVEYEASTPPAGIRVAESGVGNDRTFVNVNTPHDYERATGLIEWKPESTQDRITTGRTRPMTDADS
jgi:molybdopterin-guanine dinucleotide biosynthesis protein A